MLKSISNLGKVLNKDSQLKINGGAIKCPDGTRRVCIGSPYLPTGVSCWCQVMGDTATM
ncbi:hypothetical protein [Tenacibaculum sp. 190524A05c]|uniref:hypothetical protein n=1 Tax=Tenacibaculum platacis TaxID=3137852 RepID=UPI0031FA6699